MGSFGGCILAHFCASLRHFLSRALRGGARGFWGAVDGKKSIRRLCGLEGEGINAPRDRGIELRTKKKMMEKKKGESKKRGGRRFRRAFYSWVPASVPSGLRGNDGRRLAFACGATWVINWLVRGEKGVLWGLMRNLGVGG